jgi:hypothetical protein
MYKLLKQNLQNYKQMNDYENNKNEYRMKATEDIVSLVDKEEYIILKIKNNEQLWKVENLVYEIGKIAEVNRNFEKLAFELKAYGYQGREYPCADKELVGEQIKLIEMFNKNLYI